MRNLKIELWAAASGLRRLLTVEKAVAELDDAVAKVGADAPALAGYREHLAGLG